MTPHAGTSTDKAVSAAVMSALTQLMSEATNRPRGPAIDPVNIKQPADAGFEGPSTKVPGSAWVA